MKLDEKIKEQADTYKQDLVKLGFIDGVKWGIEEYNKQERVLCAAIWYNDGKQHPHQPRNINTGFVIAGWRHHNCIAIAFMFDIKNYTTPDQKVTQGFLTTKGDFVDRVEASKIAYEAGQIDSLVSGLTSEGLY